MIISHRSDDEKDILKGAVFYESDLPGNLNESKGKILTIIICIQ